MNEEILKELAETNYTLFVIATMFIEKVRCNQYANFVTTGMVEKSFGQSDIYVLRIDAAMSPDIPPEQMKYIGDTCKRISKRQAKVTFKNSELTATSLTNGSVTNIETRRDEADMGNQQWEYVVDVMFYAMIADILDVKRND
jgi:hypothetical protein